MLLDIQTFRFSDPGFEQCLQIRLAVFVREQNVKLAQERDAYDAAALHFLATGQTGALGTARLVMGDDGTAKIGRVAVVKPARKLGVGAALMRHIEHISGVRNFVLDAQTHAMPFYERLGYSAYGEPFMEAGIAHRHMRKSNP